MENGWFGMYLLGATIIAFPVFIIIKLIKEIKKPRIENTRKIPSYWLLIILLILFFALCLPLIVGLLDR